MIIFDLCCDAEHLFEGWFASSAEYESQRDKGLLACPVCSSLIVRRVPSVVHLANGRDTANNDARAPVERSPELSLDEAIAAYRDSVQTLLQKSEDVGAAFAEEARRIHYDEAPTRSIRGAATDDEYESLRDEGIEVLRLLVPKRSKETTH